MSTISLMSTGTGSVSTTTGVAMGRVVVVARLQLIAQAVGAALRGRGVTAEPVPWRQATHHPGRQLEPDDVLILLDDLVSLHDVEASCKLVFDAPARCIVLTRRPAGPVWGALLAAGAAAVLAPDGSLDEIGAAVSRAAKGETIMDEDRRAELVSEWEEWRAEDERLRAGLALLSPREEQILLLLARGKTVGEIVDTLSVAEATVRSQIKSMRRKLGVRSQLGAVAVLHRLGMTAGGRPTVPSPRRSSE